MTGVLVLETFADIYRRALLERFPKLRVHVAKQPADIAVDMATIDVLITFGILVSDDLIRRAPRLKWIQSLATGVDHFLRCPSLASDVLLTSARGIHGPPMRETVAYLMLSLARNAAKLARDQTQHHWERTKPWPLLSGKTAVVVGVGLSSTAIALVLQGLGMRVIGVSKTPRNVDGFDEIVPRARLIEAAGWADYLISVLPGDQVNHDRINAPVFAAMKPTAFFVNVGRGETVDERALIETLAGKKIAGAALDVFRTEPLPADSPIWDLPNVIVNPHIAGFIAEYEELVLPIVLENMDKFLSGRRTEMRNLVAH